MIWDHATITPIDDRSFTARIDERWVAMKGVHGGIVAALIVDATSALHRREGDDPAECLRAATFGYLTSNSVGESAIEIDTIRRGRSMVTTHASVVQNAQTTTVARLHHSAPRRGLDYSDIDPLPSRPDGAVRFQPPSPVHFGNVETYLHPDTTPFNGAPRAEWFGWCRPLHRHTVDQAWLTMLGDYFPPTVFARAATPVLAVTVEYSIQFHTDLHEWTLGDDEHIAVHLHSFHSHAGFAVEDGRLQHPDGTLLATVRQTRLAG